MAAKTAGPTLWNFDDKSMQDICDDIKRDFWQQHGDMFTQLARTLIDYSMHDTNRYYLALTTLRQIQGACKEILRQQVEAARAATTGTDKADKKIKS